MVRSHTETHGLRRRRDPLRYQLLRAMYTRGEGRAKPVLNPHHPLGQGSPHGPMDAPPTELHGTVVRCPLWLHGWELTTRRLHFLIRAILTKLKKLNL